MSEDSKSVFIDTSGWIALLNVDDEFHGRAAELFSAFGPSRRPLVTTDWVFAETGNGLARVKARPQFVETVRRFLESKNCRLVHINERLFQRALGLYASAPDKHWGMVDCAAFVVMRDQGIVDAMTADAHFERAGFHCLLQKSAP